MDRLTALEARVAVLEAQLPPTAATTPVGDLALLDALEQRSPDTVAVVGSVSLGERGNVRWQYARPHAVTTEQDWQDRAATLAALGNPVRLQILRAVHLGEQRTSALAELDGVQSAGQAHHHLRVLAAAGWIETVGRGRVDIPAARVVPLLAVLVATEH